MIRANSRGALSEINVALSTCKIIQASYRQESVNHRSSPESLYKGYLQDVNIYRQDGLKKAIASENTVPIMSKPQTPVPDYFGVVRSSAATPE